MTPASVAAVLDRIREITTPFVPAAGFAQILAGKMDAGGPAGAARMSPGAPEGTEGGFSGTSGTPGAAALPAGERAMITREAERAGVDPALALAVVLQESGGNPRAVSPAGAMGLMQLMPGTARELGVTDPFNPTQNIEGGLRYLRQKLDEFGGSVPLALAAYNAGSGAVAQWGGVPPYPETRQYVVNVLQMDTTLGRSLSEAGARGSTAPDVHPAGSSPDSRPAGGGRAPVTPDGAGGPARAPIGSAGPGISGRAPALPDGRAVPAGRDGAAVQPTVIGADRPAASRASDPRVPSAQGASGPTVRDAMAMLRFRGDDDVRISAGGTVPPRGEAAHSDDAGAFRRLVPAGGDTGSRSSLADPRDGSVPAVAMQAPAVDGGPGGAGARSGSGADLPAPPRDGAPLPDAGPGTRSGPASVHVTVRSDNGGVVNMSLSDRGGQVAGRIVVPTPDLGQSLASHVDTLRAALAERQVQLSDLTIAPASDWSRSGRGSGQDPQQQPRSAPRWTYEPEITQ